VSLKDVPLDQRRVTGRGLIWNAQSQSTLSPLRVVREFYVDTVICQVPDPASAAASTGVTPDLNPETVEPRRAIKGIPSGGTRPRGRFRCLRAADEQDAGQRTSGAAEH
jgi:hypothetical protein